LNRQNALGLLNWGICGELPKPLLLKEQLRLIKPLQQRLKLEESEIQIVCAETDILIKSPSKTKKLVIYPGMWNKKEVESGVMYFSDLELRKAQPTVYKKIKNI
ncbi:MAG: hypothetical protein PHD26_08695, partial [Methanosarcinaceae archaeon]|nr:hypothetical protein [Methanosarcinaceae archaeon]